MLSRKDRLNEDVLDEVYQRYAGSDPFLPITGFIDHSTMGAEALVELGLGDRVQEWVLRHRVRPYQAPVTGLAIPLEWKRALGRRECHGDWIAHFDAELDTRPFQEVLAQWVPRFVHEVGALLFHGLIRTAHATRAIEHKDAPARRGELARGLSLWAVGIGSAPSEDTQAARAEAEPLAAILGSARAGAAAFIHGPNVPALHFVTGPMAYLLLAQYLDAEAHRIAAASFGKTHRKAAERFESLKRKVYGEPNVSLDHDHLQALASQKDAHPSKLTEAALRAYEISRDEIFLKAARKALDIHSVRALLSVAEAVLFRRSPLPA